MGCELKNKDREKHDDDKHSPTIPMAEMYVSWYIYIGLGVKP